MLTKISVLLFYHRIFPVKWLTVVSYIVGALVISYNLAVIFVAAFQCIPLSSLWTGKPGQCINVTPPFLALAYVKPYRQIMIETDILQNRKCSYRLRHPSLTHPTGLRAENANTPQDPGAQYLPARGNVRLRFPLLISYLTML